MLSVAIGGQRECVSRAYSIDSEGNYLLLEVESANACSDHSHMFCVSVFFVVESTGIEND